MSNLPGILGEIADLAGDDAALALATQKGGTEVYIPARIRPGHWLAEAVGMEAARKIVRGHGGAHIMIPLGPTGTLQRARRTADRMIADGQPAAKIARAVGYTTRAIELRKQRKRERRDPRQKELFR